MSDVRCRACSAVVPERAQWCSLCFADLREPAPVPAAVVEPAATCVAPEAAYTAPEATTPPLPAPAVLSARTGSATTGTAVLAGTVLDPYTPLPGTTAAVEPQPAASGPALTETAETARTVPAAPGARVSWPCPRCGDKVALEVDACPACGAGFLSGATQHISTRLPLVGDITAMTAGQRWLVAMGISVALVVVLVVVLFLVGSVV